MENLSYLAFKLFGQADDYSVHTVSWAQFNRVSCLASLLFLLLVFLLLLLLLLLMLLEVNVV